MKNTPTKKLKFVCGMFPEELKQELAEIKVASFRTAQLLDWIYKKNTFDFSAMSNLSAALKESFESKFGTVSLNIKQCLTSRDKTRKYVFETRDVQCVESVYIPSPKRVTLCISTQVGCAFGCKFCASGADGLVRNLSADEIVSQVLLIKKDNPDRRISNIVIMGMGEPLANYEQTLRAIKIINDPGCLQIAARKITISTCGIPDKIIRLAHEGLQVELSISLHAAEDGLRTSLMPVNEKYGISEVKKAAKEYMRITNRIVTFEYILIAGCNDRREDAQKLSQLLKDMQCKVNLIVYNPRAGAEFSAPSPMAVKDFSALLEKSGINYTLRKSRGRDINSACGQLRAELLSREKS